MSTVGQVGDVSLGRQRAPKYHHGEGMRPYLRVANVFEDRIDTSDVMEMTFTDEEFTRYRLHPGDVLLNEGQSPHLLGRPAIYRGQPPDVAFTNSLIRFRAGPDVTPEWALAVFRHHMHSRRFMRESRITTNIAHLSAGRLCAVEFPVPPSAEQVRIVAAIEEQLSRVDAGVRALDRVQHNLKRMRAAVLQAAVIGELVPHRASEDVGAALERIATDRRTTWASHTHKPYKEPVEAGRFPLHVPDHWRIASLESLTDPVRVICYGILMPKEDICDGVPYVRVKDMKGWTIDIPGLRRTSREIAAKYARASLRPGDLLLAIRGSYGRVAVVPTALDGANITQDSARIAAHPTIDHRYLLYYLGGSVANRYYHRVARGVAVKGVNIGDLRSMPVPVPPYEEQVAIADEVERNFTLLDQVEITLHTAARHGSSVVSAILADAFSGGLVEQDPSEEPASLMLERIASDRAASNGHGPGTNRARRTKVTS